MIDCEDGDCAVFVGTKAGSIPIVERYVECELVWTGRHFAKVAKSVVARQAELRADEPLAVVTG